MSDLNKSVILSLRPVNPIELDRIRLFISEEVKILSITTLVRGNLFQFLLDFWKIKSKSFYIKLDIYTNQFLPIFIILASITRCKNLYILSDQLEVSRFNRFALITSVLKLISSFVRGMTYISIQKVFFYYIKISSPHKASREISKNIVFVKANYWLGVKSGGSIGHISGVCNGFDRRGWKILFVSTDAPVMFNQTIDFEVVSSSNNLILPYGFNNYYLQYKFYKNLKAVFTANQNQMIYQRLAIDNFVGVVVARKFSIPLIVEYNGSEVWAAANWGSKSKFAKMGLEAENIMLKNADLLVVISDVLKNELINRGIEAKKIVNYPNCVDADLYHSDNFSPTQRMAHRKKLSIHDNAIIITFLGTFGMWHGAEILAKVIRRLYDNDRDYLLSNKVKFMMIGDGQTYSLVCDTIGEKYLRDCVMTGIIEQHLGPLYLSISDIVISPHVPNPDGSEFFGSPTKLFEYMSMSKPIIASRLGQIETVLTPLVDSRNLPASNPQENNAQIAIGCEPANEMDLYNSIKFLVDNPKWRDTLGKNARKKVLENYTWNHHVAAIEAGLKANGFNYK